MSTQTRTTVAAVMVAALTLAACGDTGADVADELPGVTVEPTVESTDPTSEDVSFPVTIEHAYGSTTITERPERVATVAWANHEVPLALGVVPVGMSKATWGDDDGDGVLPWVERAARRARRRHAGAVRRDGRHRLRGGRRHGSGRDPRRLLRHHAGGLRHAVQDRTGRRLPGGRLGHVDGAT